MQKKNKLTDYILPVLLILLFVFLIFTSGKNVVTYIAGKTVELSPKEIYYSSLDDGSWYNYTITYNTGKKLITQNIRLSLAESVQLRKKNGFMNFRKLNGYVTYRSAFVRSVVFLIISSSFLVILIYILIGGKKREGKSA